MQPIIEKRSPLNLTDLEKQIVDSVRSGRSLLGKEGALTPLIKHALEAVLQGEIEHHLAKEEEEGGNRRNGNLSLYSRIRINRLEK